MSKPFIPERIAVLAETVSSPPPERDVAFRMEWPQMREKEFVDGALKEMEGKLLKQVREKALWLEKEAYEKGFAQGEKDGFALGQQKSAAALREIRHLLEEIGRQQEQLFRNHEREMIATVLAIARKILAGFPVPEAVAGKTLRAALACVVERNKMRIHLHPRDYEALSGQPGGLPFSAEEEASGRVTFVPDPDLSRGGCYIETLCGDVDATLETQWAEMASRVWEEFEKANCLATESTESTEK